VMIISIAFGVLTVFVLSARLFARLYIVIVIGPDDSKFLYKRKLFLYADFSSFNCVCGREYYSL
jgi:hypothetical protein